MCIAYMPKVLYYKIIKSYVDILLEQKIFNQIEKAKKTKSKNSEKLQSYYAQDLKSWVSDKNIR